MKKSGGLQHRISEVIAAMGHGDLLVVADAGLPVPPGVERIDLAVRAGLPPMLDVLETIVSELQVERAVIASELRERNEPFAERIRALVPAATVDAVPHDEFKALSARARAVVRTGECTPYANVILVSGVTF
jgi:D-ribose pyranase